MNVYSVDVVVKVSMTEQGDLVGVGTAHYTQVQMVVWSSQEDPVDSTEFLGTIGYIAAKGVERRLKAMAEIEQIVDDLDHELE